SNYDYSYAINFSLQPSTGYAVTIGPDMRDPYGTPTGESREIHFTTGPLESQAWLNATYGVGTYNAADEAALFMTTVNVDSVHYELYGLTLSQFMQATGPESYKFQPSGPPLRIWDQPVQSQLNETILTKVNLTEQEGGRLPVGFYLLEMIAPTPNQGSQHQVMVVSSANLTLKTGLREALVWATDLNSGQPLAGQPVTLFKSEQEVIASGQTGPDGVFRAEIPRLDDLWTNVYAVLGQDPDSPNFAVAVNQWSEGINPWDFGLDSAFYVQDLQAYLYTDRPVYRPGQIVYFKGVVRTEDDARYSLPDIGSLPVEMYNDRGERIFSDTLKLNEFGAFNSQLTLADEAGVGYYSIQTPYGGLGFQVAEYHKPEFQVNVTTAQSQVVQGSSIPVTVEASYFFGGPVSDAAVNYSVLTAPYYFQYEGPGYYDWSDYDFTAGPQPPTYGGYGQLLSTGETRTDAQGKASFSIPADPGKATTSQTFTIEATVTEAAGGQQVSGRVAVTVHQGDFYLGARPADYIGVAGQPTTAELLAVGWDQAPRPNQPVTVQFSKHEWFSVQELDEYGNKVYTWSAKDTPVSEVQVTTGADGKASASFTPTEGGTYKILVTGQDSGGRTVRASTYVWVTSNNYVNWRVENDDRIT
ncbi:MAG: hypothetical protein HY784_02640, partial [Chloroflexi bacterium]|nr:hypothetical protein [Chloroflexota bacterium]